MLDALQRQFKAYVAERDEEFAAAVRDSSKADRRTLLAVYRDAYVLRLHECLASDFPALRAMLGEERFFELARAYIAAHPSRHANVRWFGRHLADFVQSWAPIEIGPACSAMARFEWSLGEAHDAANATPIGFETVAGLPAAAWETLAFSFHPSLRRLTLDWRAPQAWLQREAAATGALTVDREAAPTDWLIWRADLDGQFRSMETDEAHALDAARAGADFPALCALLRDFLPEAQTPLRAAGLLRAWIDAGLISGLRHGPAAPSVR